jgi:hypothetical protein
MFFQAPTVVSGKSTLPTVAWTSQPASGFRKPDPSGALKPAVENPTADPRNVLID